jgi:cell wall-associated NlpC family hydrolase
MRIFSRMVLLSAAPLLWTGSMLQASNAVVLRPTANMHSAPSVDSDVVSQAIYGTNLEILEDKNNWSRVRTPDEYSGWIYKAFLARADHPYASSGRVATVTSLFASIYREASITKHQPVTTVPFETKLEITTESTVGEHQWLQVSLPDGRSAWLQSGDATLNPEKLTIRAMVDLSRRFVGLPYLWGGTSTFGFDCSGFTQMLERQRGIIMPRDADLQAAWTGVVPVDRAVLRAGDLLFFGASEKKITHTGLYIGNGEFVNATAHLHPMVQICKLSDPHWSKAFVTARRVK